MTRPGHSKRVWHGWPWRQEPDELLLLDAHVMSCGECTQRFRRPMCIGWLHGIIGLGKRSEGGDHSLPAGFHESLIQASFSRKWECRLQIMMGKVVIAVSFSLRHNSPQATIPSNLGQTCRTYSKCMVPNLGGPEPVGFQKAI